MRIVCNVFFNPFHEAILFLYPLKILENQKFADVFRGYRKRSITWSLLSTHAQIVWKILIPPYVNLHSELSFIKIRKLLL